MGKEGGATTKNIRKTLLRKQHEQQGQGDKQGGLGYGTVRANGSIQQQESGTDIVPANDRVQRDTSVRPHEVSLQIASQVHSSQPTQSHHTVSSSPSGGGLKWCASWLGCLILTIGLAALWLYILHRTGWASNDPSPDDDDNKYNYKSSP